MKTVGEWAAIYYGNKVVYLEDLIKQIQDDAIDNCISELQQLKNTKTNLINESAKN